MGNPQRDSRTISAIEVLSNHSAICRITGLFEKDERASRHNHRKARERGEHATNTDVEPIAAHQPAVYDELKNGRNSEAYHLDLEEDVVNRGSCAGGEEQRSGRGRNGHARQDPTYGWTDDGSGIDVLKNHSAQSQP